MVNWYIEPFRQTILAPKLGRSRSDFPPRLWWLTTLPFQKCPPYHMRFSKQLRYKKRILSCHDLHAMTIFQYSWSVRLTWTNSWKPIWLQTYTRGVPIHLKFTGLHRDLYLNCISFSMKIKDETWEIIPPILNQLCCFWRFPFPYAPVLGGDVLPYFAQLQLLKLNVDFGGRWFGPTMIHLPSLKLTAKAPKNGWLEDYPFLLGPGLFSGAFAVSFRECT